MSKPFIIKLDIVPADPKKVFSVWYDGGDEANNYYLTRAEAEDLAFELSLDGYKVRIVDMSEHIRKSFNS